jgi:hypothetical protein
MMSKKNRPQFYSIFIDYSRINSRNERDKKQEEILSWLYDSFGAPGYYIDGARWSSRIVNVGIFYHFKNEKDAVLFKLVCG